MEKEKFIEESQKRMQKCLEVFERKYVEYSKHNGNTDDDYFYAFKSIGNLLKENPEKVAFMYMMKHFQSFIDIIYHNHNVSEEVFDEKVGDLLNYILIINGIKKEQYAKLKNNSYNNSSNNTNDIPLTC
jgi:hypothetical protein